MNVDLDIRDHRADISYEMLPNKYLGTYSPYACVEPIGFCVSEFQQSKRVDAAGSDKREVVYRANTGTVDWECRLSKFVCEVLHEDCALGLLFLPLVLDHATKRDSLSHLGTAKSERTHRASTLRSSPSTPSTGFGVFASIT